MKTLHMKTYGDFLTGRPEGKQAYDAIKRDHITSQSGVQWFCDFQGVKVLGPSYCDEVFASWQEEFPDSLFLDKNMNYAFKKAFDTIEETRGIHFRFIDPP